MASIQRYSSICNLSSGKKSVAKANCFVCSFFLSCYWLFGRFVGFFCVFRTYFGRFVCFFVFFGPIPIFWLFFAFSGPILDDLSAFFAFSGHTLYEITGNFCAFWTYFGRLICRLFFAFSGRSKT